ncbi:hypothetical protein ONZ45_g1832 [Pleurotus djamor]|nr:hypothetical protein ONZ45_g15658 [Pleurotus djamor]KAJ8521472.1 hypothetical protein ONZ45_g1832 [Pleurotus djamor]
MQFITYVLLGISAMAFTMAAPMEATVDEQDNGGGNKNTQISGNSGGGFGFGSVTSGHSGGIGGGAGGGNSGGNSNGNNSIGRP